MDCTPIWAVFVDVMLSTRYIVVEDEQTVFEFQQIQSSCV